MADDDVQLTDLEVIQRFSLAIRAATGSRAEVVAALQADLAYPKKLSIGAVDINRLTVAYTDSPVFTVLDLDHKPSLLLGNLI